MGILTVFIGILFFINPCFRMLDILPDLFGCILILIGTTKLSYFDYRIATARKYTFYFAFISAVRIPLSFYVSIVEKGYLLPAQFLYSVLEGLLMVTIFVNLIGGYQYLTSRHNCDNRHMKKSEDASVISFVFAISRAIAFFLPELFSLGTQKDSFDYTFSPTAEQNAAMLKPYAEFLCAVAVLVLGIYFAIVCGKYYIGLFRDREFRAALSDSYEKYVADNIDTVNFRRTKTVFLLFFIALLLLFNQILDFVNIIPNTLSYIFLFACSVYLIKVFGCKNLKRTLFIYVPLTALSIYNNILQYELLSNTKIDFLYDRMFVKKVPELLQSTDHFLDFILPIAAEYLILAGLLIAIIRSIDDLDFLRDKDTVSIFEILFGISLFVFLASSVYTYFGQFIRTAFTYVTGSLAVYQQYDSIHAIFEWSGLISFIAMLYFAYKYASDVLWRVKAEKEDAEY